MTAWAPWAVLLPAGASLALAVLYGIFGRVLDRPMRLFTKVGAVALIAFACLQAGGSGMVIAALLLSAIGDGALVFPGRAAFLCGLVAFLLAHLGFSVAILSMFEGAVSLPAVLIILMLGLGALALLRGVWDGARGIRTPAVAYAFVIFLMVSLAVASGSPMLIAGALLFYASDAVLALETFRLSPDAPIRRITRNFVWWTYYPAQVLLACSLSR